jgi:hypothetical protein
MWDSGYAAQRNPEASKPEISTGHHNQSQPNRWLFLFPISDFRHRGYAGASV